MGEDGGDLGTSRALNVQEVTVGGLNKSLKLVGALLVRGSGVKKIDLHLLRN